MTLLALILSGVLAVIAVIHLLWAIGFWFPIRDEAQLSKAVVGRAGIKTMPGAVPCALVSVVLAFAAILPHRPLFPARDLLMTLIAVVFLLRGVVAFTPAWRRLVPEEPFATLDQRFYGPLCLALGIGYLTLQLGGF